jgi:uncharacterized protein
MTEPSHLPADRPPLQVVDVPERHRYEARLGEGGALAAVLEYLPSDLWIALLRTEVRDGFEGQGIGSQLVHRVLDDLRSRGLKVIPRCPFVVGWLERHPEQQDVLSHPLHGGEAPPVSDPPEPA